MGLEAECTVKVGRRTSRGQARFEEKEIVFRGDFRLVIPLAEVTAADARDGTLSVASSAGTARFELGPAAEKWAARIRSPRGRLDKLGVKPGTRVRVLGAEDRAFRAELEERGAAVDEGRGPRSVDLVFLRVEKAGELGRLASLRKAIAPAGAVWVLWPKGRKELREDDVRAAALATGLVDVKVVSFSDALSGLKLVIPLAQR
jgi:hypothetical protein